jgi:hypothetical protein
MGLMRRLYQSQKPCGWAGESVKIWLHSAAFSLSIPYARQTPRLQAMWA